MNDRVPPGQHLVSGFPVLHVGPVPPFDPKTWRLRVFGLVEAERSYTYAEITSGTLFPLTTVQTDFHCVTTWSRYDNTWEGVHIREILKRAKPLPSVKYVTAHSWTGYTTNMPYADLDDDDVLITIKHDGEDLEPDHGGPVRLIVPKLYAYKSAKWLDGLEFMERDQPGFWEQRGYHNHADPWDEERYW